MYRSMFRARRLAPRRAVTLVEMLLVIVIAGVLLSISSVSIGQQIARDRVRRSSSVVQGMLTEASQLAVRRRAPVNVILASTALQITDRATGVVIRQRNFGAAYDLRATLALTPTQGITIFPNGRGSAALLVTVSGSGLTSVVSRTTTGIVRRQ